jgi:hypothetical protein
MDATTSFDVTIKVLLGEQNMTFGASGCLEEVW